MTAEQVTRLDALRNRATLYEVAVTKADGARFLVCYTNRHSQRGMRNAARSRVDALRAAGVAVDREYTSRGKGTAIAFEFACGSLLRFSGRTKRDAIIEGELPFIATPQVAS